MVRVLESAQKKGAIVSLMVAVIAAASVWAGYWVWHQDRTVAVAQRDLPDVIVRWRCPQSHVFEALGSYTALPCPTCRQPARHLVTYRCPTDGSFDALVMYEDATRKLTAVQFEAGQWIQVTNLVPCPRCGGELRPKQRGPFDRRRETATPKSAQATPAP